MPGKHNPPQLSITVLEVELQIKCYALHASAILSLSPVKLHESMDPFERRTVLPSNRRHSNRLEQTKIKNRCAADRDSIVDVDASAVREVCSRYGNTIERVSKTSVIFIYLF